VVWLVYGRWFTSFRLVRRTVLRIARLEPCCNGNFETWRKTLSRESILVWHLKTYGKVKNLARESFESQSESSAVVTILRPDDEALRRINSLETASECQESRET
jgi:hypothetical protein